MARGYLSVAAPQGGGAAEAVLLVVSELFADAVQHAGQAQMLPERNILLLVTHFRPVLGEVRGGDLGRCLLPDVDLLVVEERRVRRRRDDQDHQQ